MRSLVLATLFAVLAARAIAAGQTASAQSPSTLPAALPSDFTESAPKFTATKEPVSPTGVRSVLDLPVGQHMRNSGGNDRTKDNPRGLPGQGYGLCVFTSAETLARWLNVVGLAGFQKWMESKPGGGYPQKVDAMLALFCKEKGVPVPDYVQHTGGDDAFLDLAVSTGRGCCVTYGGFDGFYRDQWGRDIWIDHMVVLAHLDAEYAAIIDNNRPGVWVWMTRREFLTRWRARGGGWGFVFLASPPPPHVAAQFHATAGGVCGAAGVACGACVCGDACGCKPGECPGKCPVIFGQNCPNGRCPLPQPQTFPTFPAVPTVPFVVPEAMPSAPAPLGNPPSDRHEWAPFDNGQWGWRFKAPQAPAAAVPAFGAQPPAGDNFGLMRDKIHQRETYTISDKDGVREIPKLAAIAALGLVNDADKWHLTAVGDAAFLARFAADVKALPAAVSSKLHVQSYPAESWPIKQFALPPGVSLRKPATLRKSEQVGTLAVADYSTAALLDLLELLKGPRPTPAPLPKPKEPKPAEPNDAKPNDPPAAPQGGLLGNLLLLVIVGGVAYLIFRK